MCYAAEIWLVQCGWIIVEARESAWHNSNAHSLRYACFLIPCFNHAGYLERDGGIFQANESKMSNQVSVLHHIFTCALGVCALHASS